MWWPSISTTEPPAMLHIKSVYTYNTDINVLLCTHIHCYICTYVFQSIKNTSAIVVICTAHEGTITTLTAGFYSHYCQ